MRMSSTASLNQDLESWHHLLGAGVPSVTKSGALSGLTLPASTPVHNTHEDTSLIAIILSHVIFAPHIQLRVHVNLLHRRKCCTQSRGQSPSPN